jgi:hypothetical protein
MRVLEYNRLIGIPVTLNSWVWRFVRKRMRVMTAKIPAKDPVCSAPRISLFTTVSDAVNPVRDLLKVQSRRPEPNVSPWRYGRLLNHIRTTDDKVRNGL